MEKEENLPLRIVELSRERFFATGFSKVTMDELCDELGISKKTMYEHFDSKDELLNAVVDSQILLIKKHISETMHDSADFVERIYQMWAMIGRRISQVCKQFHDDVRKFRPDLWKKISDARKEFISEKFSKMIEEGIHHGYVRGDIDKDLMVLMYLGAIQTIINPEVISQHSFSTEEAFKGILQVYFDGILTDSARHHFHKKILQHHYTGQQ